MEEGGGRRKTAHGVTSPKVSKTVLWERKAGPEKALKNGSDN